MKPAKVLFVCVFFFFIYSVQAQQRSLTVLGGLNASNMSVKYGSSNATVEDSYHMKMTFHAGVLLDYVFSKDRNKELSVESGVIFDGKGFKQEITLGVLEQENSLMAYYADVPVYFKYAKKLRSRDKVYAGVGAYVGVGIFGKIENTTTGENVSGDTSEDISWGSDPSDDDMKRLDYGLSAKVGYQSYGGLNFSASYDFGIPNVSAADNPEFKHRVMRVSIAYSFRFDD